MPRKLVICINSAIRSDFPSCGGRGSKKIVAALEAGIQEYELDIQIESVRCFGWCTRGPNMRLEAGPVLHYARLQDVQNILQALNKPEPSLPTSQPPPNLNDLEFT